MGTGDEEDGREMGFCYEKWKVSIGQASRIMI